MDTTQRRMKSFRTFLKSEWMLVEDLRNVVVVAFPCVAVESDDKSIHHGQFYAKSNVAATRLVAPCLAVVMRQRLAMIVASCEVTSVAYALDTREESAIVVAMTEGWTVGY